MLLLSLPYPEINPEIFGFDIFGTHLGIRWYALAYIVGIFLGYRAILYWSQRTDYPFKSVTRAVVEDLLFYSILGIIIGGRLGGTLIYNFEYYIRNPLEIIIPPYAGMSFHGGLLGVFFANWFVARKHQISLLALGDLLAMAGPIGLFFGRIANFINGELYGEPTNRPWGVKFPTLCQNPEYQDCAESGTWFYYGDEVPRHPSQIYEAFLEGVVLFGVLWTLARLGAFRFKGFLLGVFLVGYSLARIFVEFYRLSDNQFVTNDNPDGYIIQFGQIGLSMGQLLSLPMLFLGLLLLFYAYRSKEL